MTSARSHPAPVRTALRGSARIGTVTATVAAALVVGPTTVAHGAEGARAVAVAKPPAVSPAQASTARAADPLPLGGSRLTERRTVTTVAPGVSRTTIVRGVARAKASQIATTPYGPWRVNVVRIDPRTAKARLQTTFGGNLALTEPTSTLSRWAGALVGLNGGFFTFSRSRLYPGDPVGFMVHAGAVLSEPTGASAEADVLIDATTMRLRMDRYTWAAEVTNTRTARTERLDAVNTALPTPLGCEILPDPTLCPAPGRTVRLTPQFTRTTPTGAGVEVVLDRKGCIVRSAARRGTRISASEYAIQATGTDARRLADLVRPGGCLRLVEKVRDAEGGLVPLTSATYGLTGRYRLVADGLVVAPTGRNGLSARNPRSVIGRTADGTVVLATVDGRSVTSVGTTLTETAAVARALGMTDAVNLDGGGSTTLTVRSKVVNGVVGRERAVSDAVVLLPR